MCIHAHLCLSAHSTVEPSEGHYLFLLRDIGEVSYRLPQVHSLNGHGRLAGVLEVNPQFLSAGLTCWSDTGWLVHTLTMYAMFLRLTFGRVFWLRRVSTHGLSDLNEKRAHELYYKRVMEGCVYL